MSTEKGCARDQNTTQYCAEEVELAKRLAEAEEAIRVLVECGVAADVACEISYWPSCECSDCKSIRAMPAVRRALAASKARMRELVCDKCGATLGDDGWHPPDTVDDCLVKPWDAITRAEYERLHPGPKP